MTKAQSRARKGPSVTEVGLQHVSVRKGGMEVDRDLELGCPFEYWEVAMVVEIRVADVGMDVGALESEFGDAPLKLVRRFLWLGDRQTRESGEAIRKLSDKFMQHVVRSLSLVDLRVGFELLHPG